MVRTSTRLCIKSSARYARGSRYLAANSAPYDNGHPVLYIPRLPAKGGGLFIADEMVAILCPVVNTNGVAGCPFSKMRARFLVAPMIGQSPRCTFNR